MSPSNTYRASSYNTTIPTSATTPATTAVPTARPPEVLDHRFLPEPAGVPDHVDGREVRAHGDREHPAEDGRRVDPAVPGIAGHASGGHPTGGDGTGDRAQAEGHEHGRRGERRPEVPLARRARHLLAEGEARPAEDDSERSDRQRDEQRERDRRERLGEGGPQHDETEDQPDVVRLPHRADGVADHRARHLPALGAARGEVPEPGAEVGAAEQRVRGDPHHEDDRDDIAHGTSSFGAGGAGVGRGPYGPPSSDSTSPSRNRLLISRSTSTRVTPTPM